MSSSSSSAVIDLTVTDSRGDIGLNPFVDVGVKQKRKIFVLDLCDDDDDNNLATKHKSPSFDTDISKYGSTCGSGGLAIDLCGDDENDVIEVKSPSKASTKSKVLRESLAKMGFTSSEIEDAIARCNTVDSAIPWILEYRSGQHSESSASTSRMFPCPICMDEYQINEMITLSCLHRLCIDCFSGYCASKIADGEVGPEDLYCPTVNPESNKICRIPMSIHEIKAYVSDDVFDKYQRFLTRAFCEKQKMRSCPKCNEWFVDMADALFDERVWSTVTCGNCSHSFCGKCGLQPHKLQVDQDISCKDFAEWVEKNSKCDTSLTDYMAEHRLFPCPTCRMVGELSGGCKFLYCRCKCTFCALCGTKLTEKDHFLHFKGVKNATGPYGNICKGMEPNPVAAAASSSSSSTPMAPIAPKKAKPRGRAVKKK